ncbi:hypothetical protein DBR39_16835 [Chryseobacterium sp. KBW03]|uniref:hypothetical protein n=1 Tax=Chryseobacterium sp. KBW03 TaxID=2153362 RepID=UPI000F591336|nr:hypothetical protein [Chryseobacterium sp. KBW03]RQO36744.1 hypothetical protein DBR39_16835 [Chryseobacterium sp. KBW03]
MKLLYFISLLLSLCINGQSYTIQWYNMDNGLPQNSIKDIIKDKYGFIWLSMEGRIVRYDGSNFVQYRNFNFKNLSFGDFFGNIQKDSITIFNASEKDILLISQRKPQAIASNLVFKPGGTGNQKVYKQLVKNNITTRFVSYIDSYYIRLNKNLYYFENNGITHVDKKSKNNTKIDLKFPRNKLKRLFVHGDHVFIADAEYKKIF